MGQPRTGPDDMRTPRRAPARRLGVPPAGVLVHGGDRHARSVIFLGYALSTIQALSRNILIA